MDGKRASGRWSRHRIRISQSMNIKRIIYNERGLGRTPSLHPLTNPTVDPQLGRQTRHRSSHSSNLQPRNTLRGQAASKPFPGLNENASVPLALCPERGLFSRRSKETINSSDTYSAHKVLSPLPYCTYRRLSGTPFPSLQLVL